MPEKTALVIALETDRLPPQEDLAARAREFRSFERVRFAVFKAFPRTEAEMQKVKRAELRRLAVN
jgi:hypothetical protein